jgi:hypothetical protein
MGCGISNKSHEISMDAKEPSGADQFNQSNVLIKYETSHNVYRIKLKKPKDDEGK